ncbi:helix-turn-helix domain-containing protein [Microbacterium sp. G2-8]|uniref:helix-turn-helix domain-containing protein n=1 Tax=Microbacterium sp. G2-8 TaxID=2842454 RepID=UPI001C89710E|nr:helix-turn-helix domain-containing protein [Microbacterium sp. G2-8]
MAERRVTQTEQIKALTHPLRVRLLELFRDGREMTATEAATATGESVASCSFHLRQLAMYGYLEPGERRGREKPWKAIAGTVTIDAEPGDAEGLAATFAAGRALLAESVRSLDRWMDTAADDDPEWTHSSHQRHAGFWATREELSAVAEEIDHVLDRFADRAADPAKRPADARHVRFLSALWSERPPS